MYTEDNDVNLTVMTKQLTTWADLAIGQFSQKNWSVSSQSKNYPKLEHSKYTTCYQNEKVSLSKTNTASQFKNIQIQ